jgi:hypothetical protein
LRLVETVVAALRSFGSADRLAAEKVTATVAQLPTCRRRAQPCHRVIVPMCIATQPGFGDAAPHHISSDGVGRLSQRRTLLKDELPRWHIPSSAAYMDDGEPIQHSETRSVCACGDAEAAKLGQAAAAPENDTDVVTGPTPG